MPSLSVTDAIYKHCLKNTNARQYVQSAVPNLTQFLQLGVTYCRQPTDGYAKDSGLRQAVPAKRQHDACSSPGPIYTEVINSVDNWIRCGI